MSNQIYFTADLHFGHANILKHSPKRPYSDTVDIKAHDEWLLDLWRSTVDKRDDYNAQSPDLRFDVGIDGTLANLSFLTLEDIYHVAYEKITQAGCTTFAEYASNNYKSEVK